LTISPSDASELLQYAAAIGDPGVIELLFEEHRPDPNVVDEQGRTPLIVTVVAAGRRRGRSYARFRRCVKLLLCNGADIRVRDKHGHAADELALHYKLYHLNRLLIEKTWQLVDLRPAPVGKRLLLTYLKAKGPELYSRIQCPE
jgi:ankyrin repeat protein